VGYEEGGRLTEAVRRQPYSVLLLDEIEKAHRDVFNVLLQVLDDGRLTDGQGRTVDFSNTIIVMTSNIGSQIIMEFAREDGEHANRDEKARERELHERVMEVMQREFLPEFLNRIDEVIFFHPLGRQEIRQIVDLQIVRLQHQLEEEGYSIDVTQGVKDLLAEEGYDPVYGARPLKRVIQQRLQNALANEILAGNIAEGSTIHVDVVRNSLVFTTESPAETQKT
ncbi:MAG TPA: AAA family ATPase, partial [Planctomycetaceae bacterium]|nr:AAA family ATPase [Planctomycetaceae bacterium]